MRLKMSFVLLLTTLITLLPSYQAQSWSWTRPHVEVTKRANLVRFDFASRENAGLLISYAAGLKSGLTKRLRRAHQNLTLVHLFTPSGLHFSAVFLWFLPLALLYRRQKRLIWLAPLLCLCAVPWLLEGFYSLKRIGLLKAFLLLRFHYGWGVGPYLSFLLIFGCDFLFGTYSSSPHSFQLSFLFLGLLFTCYGTPKIFIFLSLFLGQFLLSYASSTPLSLFGFAIGLFLTSLFSLIFPLLFTAFWLAPWLPFTPLEGLVEFYKNLILLGHQVSEITGSYYPTTPSLLGVMAVFLRLKNRLTILLIGLLINASPALNGPLKKPTVPAAYKPVEERVLTEIRWGKRGVYGSTTLNERCAYRLFDQSEWRMSCKKRAP